MLEILPVTSQCFRNFHLTFVLLCGIIISFPKPVLWLTVINEKRQSDLRGQTDGRTVCTGGEEKWQAAIVVREQGEVCASGHCAQSENACCFSERNRA